MEKSIQPLPDEHRLSKLQTIRNPSTSTDCSVSFPSLQPPPVRDYGRCLTRGYRMLLRKGVNRYRLFRFLVSKVIYDDEGMHLDEYLCCMELFYQFDESKDPNFVENLSNLRNEGFQEMMKKLSKNTVFPYQPWEETRSLWLRLCQSVIYDSRSYFRIKGQNRNKDFRLVFKDSVLPRRTPPKAYIGIGYKDKGSRREPAVDGSPKWQEVATFNANLEESLGQIQRTSLDKESGEET
jgi:hypothetical protein